MHDSPDVPVTNSIDPTPRTQAQRRLDTETRLARDVDCWVATASIEGTPFLVPLSFDWDGTELLLSTSIESPTGCNLIANRKLRIGLGDTRDVVMIEGDVDMLPIDALPIHQGDRFAARTGFDPRELGARFCWFRVTPRRVQAWREENELSGRELMREGRWLA